MYIQGVTVSVTDVVAVVPVTPDALNVAHVATAPVKTWSLLVNWLMES